MMPMRKKVVLALAMMGICGAAQADVASYQSYNENAGMRVGTETLEGLDLVGIGVDGQLDGHLMAIPREYKFLERVVGNFIDVFNFDALLVAMMSDVAGVHHWSGRKAAMEDLNQPLAARAQSSKDLGTWAYAQVGNYDVWFGEWYADDSRRIGSPKKREDTRTVWYAGQNEDVATTLPKNAPVSYVTHSLAHYKEGWRGWVPTNPSIKPSIFTANFANETASAVGDINFTQGKIRIDGSQVKLTAENVDVKSTNGLGGHLNGNFFGTGAMTVAGMVKFQDRQNDIAFGGRRKIL